jgi:ribosomal protein S27AE
MRPTEPSLLNQIQHYKPPCPHCGGLTHLARIEPSDEADHDIRTFECGACGLAETVKIRFR